MIILHSYVHSGGPLLDSRGNLIGINTAIFTRTGKHTPNVCFFQPWCVVTENSNVQCKCFWQLLIMLKVARRWSWWDIESSNYYPHVLWYKQIRYFSWSGFCNTFRCCIKNRFSTNCLWQGKVDVFEISFSYALSLFLCSHWYLNSKDYNTIVLGPGHHFQDVIMLEK